MQLFVYFLNTQIPHGIVCLFTDAVIPRGIVDGARFWTMVYHEAYTVSGQIKRVRVSSRFEGRQLKLGIYRPRGTRTCRFELVQEFIWTSTAGISTVGYLIVP